MGNQITYPMPSDSPRLQSFDGTVVGRIQERSDEAPAIQQAPGPTEARKDRKDVLLKALKLLANFHSAAVDVFVVSQESNHRVSAEDQRVRKRQLISNAEAVLVPKCVAIWIVTDHAECCGFDDELLSKLIGKKIHTKRQPERVVGGCIESWIAREIV